MENIFTSILVLLGSILKFSLGSLAAMAANLGLGGALANITGGIIGVVLFTYLGSYFQKRIVKYLPACFKRRFTPMSRFLVRINQRFGLGGVAAISPVVLSIPVGVLFALSLTHDKRKIMLSMIISVLFWGAVLFLPYFLFNVNIISIAANKFE